MLVGSTFAGKSSVMNTLKGGWELSGLLPSFKNTIIKAHLADIYSL